MQIIKKIKLVIWDLDDTFWHGILAESDVTINTNALKAVKKLNERGIINTIVSKNDYDQVKEKLITLDCWEDFIMPSISYEPKGERIKKLIDKLQLRPSNVVFIDDNHNNLMEAKYYNPDLIVIPETEIDNILNYDGFKGKNDINLTRYYQYKHLETVITNKETFSSNLDFLRQSEIKISITNFDTNTLPEDIERAYELIDRTNQLNFTKKRISREELLKLSDINKYVSGLVSLKDKYGNYGKIGFFSVCKSSHELFQFVFSCRILNLGVENFIYQYLKCPKIKVVGQVIAELNCEKKIDWIFFDRDEKKINIKNKSKIKIYFKGGCDLTGVLRHLNNNQNLEIIEDVNYLSVNGLDIRSDHTTTILNAHRLKKSEIKKLYEGIPFLDNKVLDKNINSEYDIIIFSVLMDYTQYVFKNKFNKIKIAYGPFDFTSNDHNYKKNILSYFETRSNAINSDFLEYFNSNYICCGKITPNDFVKNLLELKNILGKKTHVIFLNGAEINIQKDVFYEKDYEAINRHKEMNVALEKIVSQEKRFHLVDIKKFANLPEHLDDSIRHYKLNIYNNIAKELTKIVNKVLDNQDLLISKKYTLKYIKENILKSTIYKKYKLLKNKAKNFLKC